MKLINNIFDNRIQANNLLFEISLGDYYQMSKSVLDKNEFQRRRVKSSSTVYSLLKKDLLEGCIIPPIVLALSDKDFDPKKGFEEDVITEYILREQNRLIILDGLQRTFTIRDLFRDLESSEDEDKLKKLKSQKLRIEVYLGINKIGILYRMLTLNTGQTPMSMRHQIEILYSDYLEQDLDGITLLLESEDRTPRHNKEYKFKEIVEGFNSYLDRDYLPMDRNSVLENIESLEKLSTENQNSDLFIDYLKAFDRLIQTLINKSDNWEFDDESIETTLSGQPFGKNSEKLFKRTQLMTGFGSAIGKLIDFKSIDKLNDVPNLYKDIDLGDINDTFNNYIARLDYIRRVAKKIGNDQRMFFHHLFRELFDKKGDSYLNFNKSIDEAFSTYLRKTQ
ncbi:hypothetical protein SAMN04488007_3468 [Maribacter aquivivus]|uniref:DUF262 domain-containing protein n=1 Tax=Maribacter aquivivus TaxID=228958 RepID=A0A1M6U328_9FLAO|nr:hypothetical protein [Maribacter aquivivus]SHK63675.1 hypothetical protein SAMN04488007_3468 [Maribacter aquivivus]